MRSYDTESSLMSTHKVAIFLQDGEHRGVVYTQIVGEQYGKEVLDEAMNQVMKGAIYTNAGCTNPLENEYIEIYKHPRRKHDFILLIDRNYAGEYIVGTSIIEWEPAPTI